MKLSTVGCMGLVFALLLALVIPVRAQCDLAGTSWRAVEIDGSPVTLQPKQKEPFLAFSAGGRVSGFSGCNRFTGGYKQDGSSLSFTPLAVTKMACPPPAGMLERSFLKGMEATTAMQSTGNTLELKDAAGKVRLKLKAR